jgi:hypothetical protein
MNNELNITNTPSEANSPFCLMGPKLNVCHLVIEGGLDAEDWTVFVGATFTGTRLDLNGANMVALDLTASIKEELDLSGFEVLVTTSCPCCFQIYITTEDHRVIAWAQGRLASSPMGMLIRCIHEHWMNHGCYDSESIQNDSEEICPSAECPKSTPEATPKKKYSGPVLDV